MYSFSNFEPVHCSLFSSNCCFLTHIQVSQETGKVIWYSCLFKNFPQFVVIHTVEGFSIVNEAGVDFFWNSLVFFYEPTDVGNLISGSFAFSKPNLYIWNFPILILLKPSLKDFEQNLTSIWNDHICSIVCTFFVIALLCNWNENWPFPVLWPLLSFPNMLTYWVQHFNSIIF